MSHPTTRTAALARLRPPAFLLGLCLTAPACGAYVTADGYDAVYVDAPIGIEAYPRYAWGDGYVYDVDGRYYHRHEGRWVEFRHAPPAVARARAERLDRERGRALRQR